VASLTPPTSLEPSSPAKQDGLVSIYVGNIGQEEVNAVDARELHRELGNKRQFTNWVQQRIGECQLEQDLDFIN
jgi:hypothetical protein